MRPAVCQVPAVLTSLDSEELLKLDNLKEYANSLSKLPASLKKMFQGRLGAMGKNRFVEVLHRPPGFAYVDVSLGSGVLGPRVVQNRAPSAADLIVVRKGQDATPARSLCTKNMREDDGHCVYCRLWICSPAPSSGSQGKTVAGELVQGLARPFARKSTRRNDMRIFLSKENLV